MHQPHEIHWNSTKIILQYVQGTKILGCTIQLVALLQLAGFSDSDWDGDPADRKSN